MYPVRTTAKAIILHENKLLVMKKEKNNKVFFVLPGGGQNLNENLHETLKRECLEEVGAEVNIKNLVLVREFIFNNHDFVLGHPDFHQMEMMFECDILNFDSLHPTTEEDDFQIGFEWISVNEINNYDLYPLEMRYKIKEINDGITIPIYIGDVN